MAADPFTIWTNQVLTPPTDPAPAAGVPYDLGVTPEQSNGPTHRDSILIHIEYDDIVPDITDGLPPFKIGAVLEAKNEAGKWKALAYQFSPVQRNTDPPLRTIRMQPDIENPNEGVPASMYPVDREIARTSRQQGRLTENGWRVRFLCTDHEPGVAGRGLESITVSISGERYDHAG